MKTKIVAGNALPFLAHVCSITLHKDVATVGADIEGKVLFCCIQVSNCTGYFCNRAQHRQYAGILLRRTKVQINVYILTPRTNAEDLYATANMSLR